MENTVTSKQFETVGGVQVSVTIQSKNNNPNHAQLVDEIQGLVNKHRK